LPLVFSFRNCCKWGRDNDRKAMLRIAIEAISLRRVDVPRRSTLLHIAWKSLF
jgi:hypothetical protein